MTSAGSGDHGIDGTDIERKYPTQYLSLEPSSSDLFGTASHQRLATCLADEIRELSKTGGAIGLEGSWGSGKSTVLELAAKEFGEQVDDHFFVFDAWAHQSDPFKGAFLDSWIQWLAQRKPTHKEYLEKKQKELRGKVTTIESDTSPVLTNTGLALLIVSLFLPVAFLWLSPFAFSKGLPEDSILFEVFRWAAFIVVLLPFVIVGLRKLFGKPGVSWNRAAIELAQRQDTVTTTKQVENHDPTTNVFSQFFWNIWKNVREPKDNYILVLDNIDRLPNHMIPDVWADIHAITGVKQDPVTDKKFVLIVPYDPAQILDALNQSEKKNKEASRDVFDKMFSRRLHVSQPISSDWEELFDKKMKEAFGEDAFNQNGYLARRLFDEHLQASNLKPTPRQIVGFLNAAITLYRQRGEDIPLPAICAHVLKREHVTENPEELETGRILNATERTLLEGSLGDKWQSYLAALHFACPVTDAEQVLLDGPIERALRSGDVEALHSLKDAVGVSAAIRRVVDKKAGDWARESAQDFSKVCEAILSSELHTQDKRYIVDRLAGLLDSLPNIPIHECAELKGPILLLGQVDKGNRYKKAKLIQQWSLNCFRFSAEKEEDEFDNSYSWARIIENTSAKLGNRSTEFLKSVTPPDGVFSVCGIAAYIGQDQGSPLTSLTFPRIEQSELTGVVKNLLSEGDENFVEVIEGLNKWKPQKYDVSLSDAIVGKLLEASSADSMGARGDLLRALDIVSRDQALSGRLKSSFDDGGFVNLWKRCYDSYQNGESDSVQTLAIATTLLAKAKGTENLPAPQNAPLGNPSQAISAYKSFRETKQADPLIDAIASSCHRHNLLLEIMDAAGVQNDSENMFVQVLQRMVSAGKIGHRLSVRSVASRFDVVSKHLRDSGLQKLADRLLGWREHFEKNFENGLDEIPNEFFSAIRAAGKIKDYEFVFRRAREQLTSLDTEAWATALREENDNLRLLIGLLDDNEFVLASTAFQESLKQHASLILEENVNFPSHYSDDWRQLSNALPEASREAFFADLINLLRNSAASASAICSLCYLYRGLLNWSGLKGEPKIVAEKIIAPLIRSGEDEDLDMLKDHIDLMKSVLSKGDANGKRLVGEAIDGSTLSIDDKIDLAKSVGVTRYISKGAQKKG